MKLGFKVEINSSIYKLPGRICSLSQLQDQISNNFNDRLPTRFYIGYQSPDGSFQRIQTEDDFISLISSAESSNLKNIKIIILNLSSQIDDKEVCFCKDNSDSLIQLCDLLDSCTNDDIYCDLQLNSITSNYFHFEKEILALAFEAKSQLTEGESQEICIFQKLENKGNGNGEQEKEDNFVSRYQMNIEQQWQQDISKSTPKQEDKKQQNQLDLINIQLDQSQDNLNNASKAKRNKEDTKERQIKGGCEKKFKKAVSLEESAIVFIRSENSSFSPINGLQQQPQLEQSIEMKNTNENEIQKLINDIEKNNNIATSLPPLLIMGSENTQYGKYDEPHFENNNLLINSLGLKHLFCTSQPGLINNPDKQQNDGQILCDKLINSLNEIIKQTNSSSRSMEEQTSLNQNQLHKFPQNENASTRQLKDQSQDSRNLHIQNQPKNLLNSHSQCAVQTQLLSPENYSQAQGSLIFNHFDHFFNSQRVKRQSLPAISQTMTSTGLEQSFDYSSVYFSGEKNKISDMCHKNILQNDQTTFDKFQNQNKLRKSLGDPNQDSEPFGHLELEIKNNSFNQQSNFLIESIYISPFKAKILHFPFKTLSVFPGQKIQYMVDLLNNGDNKWPQSVQLRSIEGSNSDKCFNICSAEPQEIQRVRIEIIAPISFGKAKNSFRLSYLTSDGRIKFFGPKIQFLLKVITNDEDFQHQKNQNPSTAAADTHKNKYSSLRQDSIILVI